MVFYSLSQGALDFVVSQLLLFECINIDVYTGKAGVLILALFDFSCFLILYLRLFSHGNGDRHADVLIHLGI